MAAVKAAYDAAFAEPIPQHFHDQLNQLEKDNGRNS
jgi:hypothetical protein